MKQYAGCWTAEQLQYIGYHDHTVKQNTDYEAVEEYFGYESVEHHTGHQTVEQYNGYWDS